jgi:hypothetical membrane protein
MMESGRNKSAAWGGTLLFCSALQFVVLTIAAMWMYPGGAKYVLGSDHYLFFQNFFSDLGATRTHSGRNNLPSEVLFVVALSAVGLGMIGSSSSWHVIAAKGKRGTGWGVVAQVLSVLSGACFVGVGVTPWNLVLAAHNAFVKAAFLLLMGFLVSITMLQVKNRWPSRYTICNWIYLVMLAAYLYVLFYGPRLDTGRGLAFQVAAQKIIVYASILNLGYQALGIRHGAMESAAEDMELRGARVNRSSLLSG